MSQKVLLIGAKGILGTELTELLPNAYLGDVSEDKNSENFIDITNLENLNARFDSINPSLVINCAAYTQVDLAEQEVESCLRVNTQGVINIVKALKNRKTKLIHISSDYVYGNLEGLNSPIKESQETDPCGVYGYSKYLADEYILQQQDLDSLIIRTSWLHGRTGPSFVKSIVNAANKNDKIKVVNDQYGSPTWVPWLAQIITKLIDANASGVYNVSSKGEVSWYDFAKKIVEESKIDCKVETQSTEELARPARRPKYSVLDKTKLENLLGIECISWKQCVSEHIQYIKE